MTDGRHEGACRVLVGLLEARTGQTISPGRIWRIETALRPVMRNHGIDTLDLLVGALLAAKDKRLVGEVVDALLNNESYFFRDHVAFDALNDEVFEDIRTRGGDGRRTMSIWLAGCSTGQEAYSIAMMLADAPHKWRGWNIRMVATDISGNAIARARAGCYSQFEIQRGLSMTRMVRWFDQTPAGWQVKDELRGRIDFREHSLLGDLPPSGPFDVVLCRNVLLYFAAPVRRDVFARLHDALAPQGVLMLGAGETTMGQTDVLVPSRHYRGFYGRSDDRASAPRHAPRISAGA
ncbi:MAG: protein-glutamate O-methyltransferase CheR [Sphingomonadales bacterium]|nr:protein-glutamate O-methyltransferase CheR [Sphingomonadales bacterium]